MNTIRPLYKIASEIIVDMENIAKSKGKYWHKMFPYAKPYVEAMMSLDKITDNYGWDSGMDIVCRFLSNANTWKGETAKILKSELRAMAGLKSR